jgi:hypothetical protein
MGRFFLDKIVQGVAYEKLKLEDGKDMKIYENLDFFNCNWHDSNNPTTLEK